MAELPVSFIQVTDVVRITPQMVRVTFDADTLEDTVGTTPDQQVKLCFPRPGQSVPVLPEQSEDATGWYHAFLAIPEDERPWMRSFTVRRRRPGSSLLDIDFVLHGDAGPATAWAGRARPGDQLGMVGPSAIYARPATADEPAGGVLLLAGDETALPAVATLVEALPAGARAVAYLEVADAAEEQALATDADLTVHWLHRDGTPPGHSDLLPQALRAAEFPEGIARAWIAGESGVVRALRRHLVADRGLDKRAVEFSGYWRVKLTQDDAPTAEDLAEAQERLAEYQAAQTGRADAAQ
ncbi:siderophore-interacting protein [Kitasatospora sp. NPDC054939]